MGLETGWNCHISFSEKTPGFDEHSTLTAGSEGKIDETADEYIVSHVTPAHDDDVTGNVAEGDNEGQSCEHEDIFEDIPQNEEIESDKKVKWQDSEGIT